jgi:hypothetical protein
LYATRSWQSAHITTNEYSSELALNWPSNKHLDIKDNGKDPSTKIESPQAIYTPVEVRLYS